MTYENPQSRKGYGWIHFYSVAESETGFMANTPQEIIREASNKLDGQTPLDPSVRETFDRYYVKRPDHEHEWVRESIRTRQNKRPFHWFYTGHTGSGKSTELNLLMSQKELTNEYLPIYYNIEQELDVRNLEQTDVIFAMAQACIRAAEQHECNIPEDLSEYMINHGKEIFKEELVETGSTGKAGINARLDIGIIAAKLGEEVKSGGAKRKSIRERLFADITGFIRNLDDLADVLRKKTGHEPLCILDGLDHVDTELCRKLFSNYFITLTKPNLSKWFVVPLSLLNTDFASQIGGIHSTLPNIKVYKSPGNDELDDGGRAFYKDLISRYIPIEHLTGEALDSLFLLSAGIVRDMIRNTGDACGYAADKNAAKVELDHVRRVWDATRGFYRRILYASDYETLKEVDKNPYPQGMDNLPRLLFQKAVIFYPNGEGWYGVHPVVREIIHPGAHGAG